MKSLLIFDLDGTLLDTVADLATSTNYALTQCGFSIHKTDDYRFFVGNGINKLFERALPEKSRTSENILQVRNHFLKHYEFHNTDLTTPYPGVIKLLKELQASKIKLAVASNKYQQATGKLIRHFFPEITFIAVFGQREGIPTKPDSRIIHDILSIAKVKKEEVLYIGDSGVDMQTAQNAGIDAAGVTWGFRPRIELEKFSPKYIVSEAKEISKIIQ